MYECRLNYPESKENKEVYFKNKSLNPEGVGAIWKRVSGGRKVSDSSNHSIPLEKVLEQGAEIILKGKRPKVDTG